jgi:hypothetical protein
MARGWVGHAAPDIKGSWSCGEIGTRGPFRILSCDHTNGDRVVVEERRPAQLWYMHHSDAYELMNIYHDEIDIKALKPLNGPALHAKDPTGYPVNDFVFWIHSELPSRRITKNDLWFRLSDLEQYSPKSVPTDANVGLANSAILSHHEDLDNGRKDNALSKREKKLREWLDSEGIEEKDRKPLKGYSLENMYNNLCHFPEFKSLNGHGKPITRHSFKRHFWAVQNVAKLEP